MIGSKQCNGEHMNNHKYFPLGDEIGYIELLHSMGSDLDIVNDARASYDKVSNEWAEKDEKLLRYLINHEHWSPFRGVVFKFRVKAPLFICRQWWKHVIASNHNDEQLGWNEQSLRYVDMSDKSQFYIPPQFRRQDKKNKQSSTGQFNQAEQNILYDNYMESVMNSLLVYQAMIAQGVCREQARGVLPTSVYTTWVWTVSLQALVNFLQLRLGKGAQDEITAYAICLKEVVKEVTPYTYKYLLSDYT